jgi:hypothetical protein
VLAAGGKPGGFSAHGGRATKAKLLAIEGAVVKLTGTRQLVILVHGDTRASPTIPIRIGSTLRPPKNRGRRALV